MRQTYWHKSLKITYQFFIHLQGLTRMSHRGGREAAKSNSIRRWRELKVRKSSYDLSRRARWPSSHRRIPIFGQGRTHDSPNLAFCPIGLATPSFSAAQSGDL